jgi:hypothetical protein
LPQDLQRQLAQVLYEIRHTFTPELLQSPELLGSQIDAHSWDTRSRFRKLAEEHLLVGQIAAALLMTESVQNAALILPATLQRIATDLDRNRRSREWLKDAQRRASTVRLRGLHRGFVDDTLVETEIGLDESEARRTVVELGIEPTLVLRRTDRQTWNVRLQLPDLSGLLRRFPEFRNVLANERCVVAGLSGAPLPRGFLLYGTQEVSLSWWPGDAEVLLKFDNSPPQLDFLLTAECLLSTGPRWLFRLHADGSATEIKGHVVQPGSSYIILSLENTEAHLEFISSTPVKTTCAGVRAVTFEVPEVISQIYSDQLITVGFHASSGLYVCPVGLPASKWDDAGDAEWLTTDSPMIAVSADFEIRGLLFNLLGPSATKLELSHPLDPNVFVELGNLDPGRYKLYVVARRSSETQPIVHGTLSLNVRAPKPLTVDITKASPFAVLISPLRPSLEQLWDGTATVLIVGPVGRKAEGELQLFKDSDLHNLVYQKKMAPLRLPCATAQWHVALDEIKSDVRAQNAYDESAACILSIRAEELGHFSLPCERLPTPIRWVLKHENNGYSLKLVQLNEQSLVQLSHYAFCHPDQLTKLPFANANGFRVPAEGGLYVAVTERTCSAIVVPPLIHSLSDLGVKVEMQSRQRTEQDISQLLRVLQVWVASRVTGEPISRDRKDQVIKCIEDQLIALLCGDSWLELERQVQKFPKCLTDLKNAISSSVRYAPIGQSLISRQADLKSHSMREVCEYLYRLAQQYLELPALSIAHEHGVSRQQWVVEFAFRLASEASQVQEWAREDFVAGLHYVLQHPILLRIGRFAAVVRATEPAGVVFKEAGRHQ